MGIEPGRVAGTIGGFTLIRHFVRYRRIRTGVSPGEQMLVYYANELRDQGVPAVDVIEADALRRDVWTYLFTGAGYEKARRELDQARAKRWFAEVNSQQDRLFGPLHKPSD